MVHQLGPKQCRLMGKVLCFGSRFWWTSTLKAIQGGFICMTLPQKCQERCFKTSWSTFVEKIMSVMIFKGQSCYLWRWGAVLLWRRPPGRHIYSENSGRCKEVVPEFVSGWDMKMTLKYNPCLAFVSQWWMTLKEVFATGKFGIHTRFFCLYLLHQELVYGLDGSYQQNKHPMHLVTGQVHHSSCFGYEMGL